jgi:hypothetical protein
VLMSEIAMATKEQVPSQETDTRHKGLLGEEPCAVKVARTVLKQRRGK